MDEPVLAAWLNFRCRQALNRQGTKATKEREVRLKSLTYMKITEFIGGFPARDEEAEHFEKLITHYHFRSRPTQSGSARIFGRTRKSRLIRIPKQRRSDYSGATP